ALTFQNHTDCPLTDFGGKTSIFSHPVYLFLRKFSLQDSRGGSKRVFLVILFTSFSGSLVSRIPGAVQYPFRYTVRIGTMRTQLHSSHDPEYVHFFA
ncbi:hypothetical protein U9185_23185, partial [Escherichia coli]